MKWGWRRPSLAWTAALLMMMPPLGAEPPLLSSRARPESAAKTAAPTAPETAMAARMRVREAAEARVNGQAARAGAAVRPGDEIRTGEFGRAAVAPAAQNGAAGEIEIGNRTRLRRGRGDWSLNGGLARVETGADASEWTVRLGETTVAPSAEAEIEIVELEGGRVYLSVARGRATVSPLAAGKASGSASGWRRPVTVTAGSGLRFTAQQQEQGRKASDQAPSGASPALIAAGVVGAVAVVAGLALHSGHSPNASPTQP